jgi:hypothetical protein
MVEVNKYIADNGHLIDEYISLYIDAHLLNRVKELPLEILKHVEDCEKCKQEIIEGYNLLKNINVPIVDEHPYFSNNKRDIKTLKKTYYYNSYKIAASIIVIITLGIIGFYTLNLEESSIISDKINEKHNINDSVIEIIANSELPKDTIKKNNESKQIEKGNIIKKEESGNLLAKADLSGKEFQVSPIMLSMLGENTRAEFLEVDYPKDSTIFENKQTIDFSWNSNINEAIKLKIFNYKDELVFESKVLEHNKLKITENLLPGAYIWKIESSNEIFHLGLFFIKK